MIDRELNCRSQTISNSEIVEFQRNLLIWFNKNGRRFPWRYRSISNYKKVLSEILLQRTRAETVAGFFRAFVNKYPSWQCLARAEEIDLGKFLRPIGLWNRRASTIKKLATEMDKRNGRFPRTREAIESLPGVGQYIANAILLFSFGESQPLLDTNMARVLERYFGPRKLADIRYDKYLQELSRRAIACDSPTLMNWAILDLAAIVCKRRDPTCGICPINRDCLSCI